MDPAARLAAFKRIKAHYDERDRQGLLHGTLPMRDTTHGFWGTTNMNDAYTFFSRIRLERFTGFVDLGCGDGRVVLIASLFTDATGIEGDGELYGKGKEAMEELGLWKGGKGGEKGSEGGDGPDGIHAATLKNKDYYGEDLSRYDIIFMFPDNRYDAVMVGKLLSEFTGHLFVYNRIHAPPGIRAGKTYWIDQMPIASYPINVEERSLERE